MVKDTVVNWLSNTFSKASDLVEDRAYGVAADMANFGNATKAAAIATTGDLLWKVERPIRVVVKGTTLSTQAILANAGIGLVIGAVWPPAVPIGIGCALLQLLLVPDETVKAVDEARAEALAKLPQQVSTRTKWVQIILDVKAGKADGVVLRGPYKGAVLSKLDEVDLKTVAEMADEKTKEALESIMLARLSGTKIKSLTTR
jgi:hypothetical protein